MRESFQYDVFLSYSSRDRRAVQGIAERLRNDGLRVWFDQFVIGPGDLIPAKLQEGLHRSRCLALFMSPDAVSSDWTLLERSVILFQDPLNRGGRFVPILLEDCEIPPILIPYRRIDLRSDFAAGYRELLEFCRLDMTQQDETISNAGAGREREGTSSRATQFYPLSRPDYLRDDAG